MNKIFEDREFGAVAICKNARSRRLSIRVRERQNRSGARISITIPYRISYQDAIDYLDSHRDWVRDVLRKQEKAVEDAAREGMAVLRIGDGTTIPTLTSDIVFKVVQGLTGKVNVVTSGRSVSKQVYSGAVYPVKDGDAGFFGIGENASRPADVPCRTISFPAQWLDKDGVVTDDSCRKFLGRVLVEVLRNEAKSYLAGRLAELAERYGFKYGRLVVKHNSSNWGSCSKKGNINLNINLIRLPQYLSDYVMIHELCHLREMNHGPEFHNMLGRLCIDNLNRLGAGGDRFDSDSIPFIDRILGSGLSRWRMV